MALVSSNTLTNLKIIGCSKQNYTDWSNNNQINENAIYLVDEGAEANCRVTYEATGKLIIKNVGAPQGGGNTTPIQTIVIDGDSHSIDYTPHMNDPLSHAVFSNVMSFTNATDATSTTNAAVKISGGLAVAKTIRADKVYGAVWNDYAEYRNGDNQNIKAGQVVIEKGDDSVILASKRLQPGGMIVSDSYGFIIGNPEGSVPIAVSGRVLAYTHEDRDYYRENIGRPVGTGPNGTVTLMSNEEAANFPWLIIGTVSAVPDYKIWNNIPVNDRVWIKVR